MKNARTITKFSALLLLSASTVFAQTNITDADNGKSFSIAPSQYFVFTNTNPLTIPILTASGGTLVVQENRTGPILFEKLILQGAGPLEIYFQDNSGSAIQAPYTGTKEIFIIKDYTGDASIIKRDAFNTGFTDILSASEGPNGVIFSGQNFRVNLIPAVDFAAPTTSAQALIHANAGILRNIQYNTGKAATFLRASSGNAQKQAMRQPGKANDKAKTVIENLATNGDAMISDRHGAIRGWVMPFYQTLNNTQTQGFTEEQYGMLVGFTHYLGASKSCLHYMGGFGLSKNILKSDSANKTDGKYMLFGVNYVHNFLTHGEVSTHVHGIAVYKNQERKNTLLGANTIAKADFKEHGLSFSSALNYVFKFNHKWSLRPSIGAQLGLTRRSKFQEHGVLSNFAQKFKTHISRGGEMLTGLGVRKKWTGDAFDGAITGIYEVGIKSGNGKTRVQASTVARPNAVVNLSGKTPGKITHYLSLLGSVQEKNNWKIIPSVTGTLQNKQNSFMFALKLEKTF